MDRLARRARGPTGPDLATRNHDVIRAWAEARGAQPATIVGGKRYDGRPGVLTFDFPYGGRARNLEPSSWDEWFDTFDRRKLVFLFQEHLKDGRPSNVFQLDSPDREDG